MCGQITNIRVVKEAMSEAAYLYAELVDLGAGMRAIDCGGGLGIDYDGSNTDAPASLSYTMQVALHFKLTPPFTLPQMPTQDCTSLTCFL